MRGSDDFVDYFVGGAPPGFVDLERLSGGSEGDVYRATEAATGVEVVLKPVRNRGVGFRAFDVLRRATSAHLPELRGFVEVGRAAFLVLRWVPGRPLAPGPIELPRACREAAAVADALAALHEAGLHHGDLSPGNVLSTDDGRVWVVDLALLGRRGTGTPGFIAPEVLQGGGGAAADLFSLGCLLCWRMFGEVPWASPREVLGADPAQALAPLLVERPLPRPLVRLLERLLTANPEARVPRGRALVAVLENLARQHEAKVHAPHRTRYRLPTRWPYAGPALAVVVAACRSARPPRIVVVSGPRGVGRGRIVEELMLGLQQGGSAVQRVAPGAWRNLPREGVFAFVEGLDLPAPQRDAWLVSQAQQPGPTLLVTSEAPLPGWGASAGEGAAVVQLRVERWDVATVRTLVDQALETPETDRWTDVLLALTGGWPARVVSAIEACARAGVEGATRAAVERAVSAHAATEGTQLDETTAHRILALHWRPTARMRADALPAELRGDGGRPHAAAVLAARSRLGEHRLRRLARRFLRRVTEPSLALALDADDPKIVHRSAMSTGALGGLGSMHLGATRDRAQQGGAPGVLHWSASISSETEREGLVAWVERRTGVASGELRRWAARHLLCIGHGERASRVLHGLADPASRFLLARALHRLGDRNGALSVVLSLEGTPLADAAIGLKWRIWAEQGDAPAAVAEAARPRTSTPMVWAAATADLWAGFAAWATGDVEQAQSWLENALTRVSSPYCGDHPDEALEVSAVRARALQLLGNLAHHRGELHAALRWHREAAEAFAAAGEPIGEISVRANLAAIALPLAQIADGIEHGRHAVTAMVARGHVDGLTAAGANLVQLLVQYEALAEAQAVMTLLTAFLPRARAPVDDLRLERIRLELIRAEGRGAARLTIAAALEACAARFEAVGSPREAMDTWLLAAAMEREEGQVAGPALAAAARLADGVGDAELDLRLRVEALRHASRFGALGDVELATRRVLEHPMTPRLRSLGYLALADDVHHALGDARRRTSTLATGAMHENSSSKEDEMKLVRPASPDPSHSPGQQPLGELDPSIVTMQALLTGESRAPQPEATSVASRDHDSLRWTRLIRVYRRLATETTLEPLLQQVVDSVLELTGGERGVVAVLREDGTRLEVTRDLGGGERQLEFSQSIVRQVLSSGEAILSVDAASDERFDSAHSISHLNLRSVIAAPLRFRGERLGALYIDHRLRRGQFDESDLEQVEAFADLAASAVAHARALEALHGQASTLRGQAQMLEQQRRELAQRLEARDNEVLTLREAVRAGAPPVYRGLVGSSPAMARVFRLIDRLADSPAPVVVYGESGTGKELVARAIHEAGARATRPFVAENCAAIPESLLEGILFGHAKGAFTGAHRDQPGLFEAADSGTLFLDEIGEMSPSMQAKLLRVLQESEVRRIGETRPRRIDVRVIAASNQDLKQMVDAGTFRADLYYRVNVVRLELPPLRERSEDIVPLVEHFWQMHAKDRPLRLSPEVRRRLLGYAWPGNVRELANEVQRWVALSDDVVELADLSAALADQESGRGVHAGSDPNDLQLRPRVEQLERELIERALERTGGNQTQAAVLLGLSRFGLQKKLKRLEETQARPPTGDALD